MVVLLSCGEGPPTGLSNLDDDRVPAGGSPAPRFSLDCGGGGCDGGSVSEELIFQTTYPLGGTTPIGLPDATEPRVFKFTFQGQYEVWFPPPPPPDTGSPRFFTSADSRGFLIGWGCQGALRTWYTTPGNFGPGVCWSPPMGTAPTIAVIQRVSGEGILQGGGPFGMNLIGPPHQVSVHRLETSLRLRRLDPPSSPPVGQVGVLAEVIPAPYWVGGFRMPMRVLSWAWTPTQVGVTPETVIEAGSCSTGFTEFWYFCSFTARESGTLTVRASVNGGPEQEASITVNVVDCATGDSLLDGDPLLRRLLRDAMDASNPTGPADNRRERLGMRICDAGGCVDTLFSEIESNSTACTVDPPFPLPEGTMVTVHTHPFFPGVTSGDPTPRSQVLCPRKKSLRPGQTAYLAEGPSPSDLNRTAQEGVRSYVVDKRNVYAIPGVDFPASVDPDEAVRTLRQLTDTIPRGTCDPLAF